MSAQTYIPARWQPHSPRRAPIRVVVIHTTEPGTVQPPEALLHQGAARSTAHYFQTVERPASAHVVIDAQEVVECVKPENEAVGAPGVNADGYHIELYGFAEWGGADWKSTKADLMLRRAGAWAGQVCAAHALPVLFLNAEMLKGGGKGLTGHKQASDAYHPGGHWDPGPAFPWPRFLGYVRESMGEQTDPTTPDRFAIDGKVVDVPMVTAGGQHYLHARELAAALGWLITWDPETRIVNVRTQG